ncbi:Cysteine-rich protein 2 [Ataeniobius toweri]|uniref:Cysteine-rich protein 2 n=2 Tax=Goodeidae TaxID=28758 RepID=A0ABU7B8L6_9TELE|nr:Cysteine-rich protein 2 [Ataeniobius toweri]
MASKCPKCDNTVYFAEKVSSLGKDWHKFCLKCERCSKTLNPGGHAEVRGAAAGTRIAFIQKIMVPFTPEL